MRLLALLIFITSCNLAKKPVFREITDENYTIQIMSLKKNDNGASAYKVRILPKQKIVDEAGKQLQDVLWYQTENTFYLIKRGVQFQPDFVQPVANGVVNCYEYMVVFNDINPSYGDNDNLQFVFNDRHITREKFLIRLF